MLLKIIVPGAGGQFAADLIYTFSEIRSKLLLKSKNCCLGSYTK